MACLMEYSGISEDIIHKRIRLGWIEWFLGVSHMTGERLRLGKIMTQ